MSEEAKKFKPRRSFDKLRASVGADDSPMRNICLRFPQALADLCDVLAEKGGFKSRSDYIRSLILQAGDIQGFVDQDVDHD